MANAFNINSCFDERSSTQNSLVKTLDQNDQLKKVSQKELIKKLFALILLLQQVEQILSSDSATDFKRIAEQSHAFVELAKIEQNVSKNETDKIKSEIEKKAHANLFQKIFGGIAAVLSFVIGFVMTATGAGVGIGLTLMTVGVLSMVSLFAPKALSDLADGIAKAFTGSPAAKFFVKMVIILAASAGAAIAGNALGFTMMFVTLWNAMNPTKDAEAWHLQISDHLSQDEAEKQAATKKEVWIANLCVSIVISVISMAGPAILSKIGSFASAATEEIATEGSVELETLNELSEESSSAAVELVEEEELIEPESETEMTMKQKFVKKLKELLTMRGLNVAANSSIGISQIADSISGIASGAYQTKLANATFKINEATSNSELTASIRKIIDDIEKMTSSFLSSVLKTFQMSNRSACSNMFIDQMSFARVLAKLS